MNLRCEGECVALAGVLDSDSPAAGLRCPEFHASIRPGIPGVFVEYEIARLEMDRVLEVFGSGLVRALQSRRVRNQVDLHFPLSRDVSSLLVVGKIVAVDLIEARGVATVKNNRDVV